MRKGLFFKRGKPTTTMALERELGKSSSDLFKTVGAIHPFNVKSRGIFSKGRSLVLDKLLFCPVSRYFIFKFFNLGFSLGKFFLGGYMSFLNYVHLLVDESNPLSEHLIALNTRKGRKTSFNTCYPESDIHNKNLKKNDSEIMDDKKEKINKKATNVN